MMTIFQRDVPTAVRKLYQPQIIMLKTRPRYWTFQCASCERDQRRFGWWGYVRCGYCDQLHAPKWDFRGSGF
jgi:hypothetical protein